jgi:acyl-coenzyme A synthetase/AMP-(fatty) acid ligase
VKEYCIFAANYLWSAKTLGREMLILLLRLEQNQEFTEALKQEIITRNRRLADFKRIGGYLLCPTDFPRTASMKIKRTVLAEEVRKNLSRAAVVEL